jgi:hypothetical protein
MCGPGNVLGFLDSHDQSLRVMMLLKFRGKKTPLKKLKNPSLSLWK